MMICTPCGELVGEGQAAIYGIEIGGRLEFGWTCCHKPVGDVAVIIASASCMEKWLRENPVYVEEIGRLIAAHENGKEHR
jgi:hypothetical protein